MDFIKLQKPLQCLKWQGLLILQKSFFLLSFHYHYVNDMKWVYIKDTSHQYTLLQQHNKKVINKFRVDTVTVLQDTH